jgi:dihydrodipicolinate synthase/N-acetylneuraminate lyase
MADFDPRSDLRGIVASLHTPFTADDAIDEASLVRLVDHCAHAGCCGVLVAAVAGEVGSLRPEERRRMLAVVAEAAAGRLGIVAGVSAADLETSRALAREAAAAGAAMVLWQPPPGIAEAAAEAALLALGEAGPGQVMLQDLDWQGPGLAPELIARLADRVPGLTAVKIETVPAGPKYSAVRSVTGDRLHLSGGWAAMQMLDGLARGLDAFIPSGILPVYVRIFDLWSAGRHDAARALFERALPVLAFSNQHIDVSIRFWKHVRRLQGIFDDPRCRPPVRPLDRVRQEEAERLAARALALEACGD